MKGKNQQTYLTYGSIISISHVQDDDSFITSDGFVKRSVMLRNFGTIDKLNPNDLKKAKNRPYYNCLFQIYPKVSNTTKTEITKELLNEGDDEEANVAPDDILEVMLASQQEVEEEESSSLTKESINEYKGKLLNEFKYNLDTFEKAKNLKISYKQTIQFLHLASSKFLACYQKESRYEQSNYRMILDDLPSDATLFKIIPAYKYQKEGEQVIYASDIVYIVRAHQFMSKETYLHASGEMGDFGKTNAAVLEQIQSAPVPIEEKKGILKKQATVSKMAINQPVVVKVDDKAIKKREVNASVEDKTQWKLTVYSEYVPETQTSLKCGDVIWLHHSETNTTIAAARRGKDEKAMAQIDLAQWLSVDNLELKIIEGRSKESYEEYIGDTYSMWIIEYEQFQVGGLVQYERNYRFKHLSSGLYLAGRVRPANNDKHNFYLSLQRTENTLFRFMPLKNQALSDKVVRKGSYVYICNSKDFWIDVIPVSEEAIMSNIKSPGMSNVNSSTVKSDDSTEDKYAPVLHQEQHKCDQSVFKLYASTSNDVWEIQFVLSCIKILMNYLVDIKDAKLSDDQAGKDAMKDYMGKISNTRQCLSDLDDFCNNKLYNSTPEQKYETVNPFRQKLLREQYYIDILMRILDNSLSEEDLHLWQQNVLYRHADSHEAPPSQRSQTFIQTMGVVVRANTFKTKMMKQSKGPSKGISQAEMLGFVAHKIDICVSIFSLLGSICKDNPENELYTFNLVFHIVQYVRYIPQAITCLISIIKNNPMLLNKLSENLQIDFEYQNPDFFEPEEEAINKIRSPPTETPRAVSIKQSAKTQRQNLLVHFMQLVETEECVHRADFLKFLRSVCRFEDQGINCNQENIFKLYKKLNDKAQKMGVVLFKPNTLLDHGEEQRLLYKDGNLILPSRCHNRKEMNFIVEQLQFYSDVSFGRNYLWKKELQNQFEKEFLFHNIWNTQPFDQRYTQLQPSFCKIAMSLYVDYEPLNRVKIPEHCRLFRDIDLKHRTDVFKQDDPDVQSYLFLVENLISYLQSQKQNVKSVIESQQRKLEVQKRRLDKKLEEKRENKSPTKIENPEQYEQLEASVMPRDTNVLCNEILYNSMEMLSLVLELDLFEIISTEGKRPDDYYRQIIEIVISMLYFDRKNLAFFAAMQQSQSIEVERRRTMKREKKELINMNPLEMLKKIRGMMGKISNLVTAAPADDDDEDQDDDQFDSQIDDVQMYTNPLMRGFIFLNNKLEGANNEDNTLSPVEVDLKLKICDVLDHFLDRRQDFLISNLLTFFKHHIVLGEQILEKEDLKMEEQMRAQGRSDDDIVQMKNVAICERAIKFHALGLLPNIAKTGIMLVDEPKKEGNDPFGGFSLKKMGEMMTLAAKKPENFRNYFVEQKIEVPETYDVDGYFSLSQGDDDLNDGPIACLLPYLLSSIYFINDTNLERRCLKVITRLFNQREELYQNVSNLQIIFDPSKTMLYELLRSIQHRLSQMIDRSELWFSDFIKRPNQENPEFEQTLTIIRNLRWAFYHDIRIDGEEIQLHGAESLQTIDEEKQSIVNSLNVHIPAMNLIKDQMQNLVDFIQQEKVAIDRRIEAVTLFQCAFQFLRNFCKQNHANQIALYEKLPIFLNHLEFNLGQVKLVCEIFQDNNLLLTNHVNHQFLHIFVNMIEQYGRQERFLDPFLTIIRYRDKYIFDNQLQVLNIFLSTNKGSPQNYHLLYAKSTSKELEFSFEGKVSMIEDDVVSDLENENGPRHDHPYQYHKKLLELMLSTTLIQAEKANYNPNQEDIMQRDNFTISVAKLKKTFKASYLMSILRAQDSFIGAEGAGKGATNFKSMIKGAVKDPKLQKENTPGAGAAVSDESKKGLTLLKRQVCQFFRLVHITSEKSIAGSTEMVNDMAHLFEIESARFDRINHNENLVRYVDYLIEGLLPLSISYYERIINVRKLSQGPEEEMEEQEEQKDLDALVVFALKLSRCLDMFLYKSLTKKRQVLIIKKFFDFYPTTPFHQMMLHQDQEAQQQMEFERSPQKLPVVEEINPEMKARIMYLLGGVDLDQPMNQNININISPAMDHGEHEDQPLLVPQARTIFNMVDAGPNQKDPPALTPTHPNKSSTKIMGFVTMIHKKPKKNTNYEANEVEGLLNETKSKQIEQLWYDFKNVFCSSKIIEEELEKETEMLANALIQMEQYIAADKQKLIDTKLDLKLIVKQFINFLQYSVNNVRNKSTIITLLKVLRKVIQKEEDKEKKVEIQNTFNQLGATRMVLIVLSESSGSVDKETYRHFLMFINSLLDEGNQKVQRTIFEFFTSYQKSEVIFQRFNQVINKQIESISQRAKEKKQALQRKAQQGLDEEGDEMSETQQEMLQAQEDERVMNQVLKFLQNCVEGHYLDLQNYIRQQTSSRNSYNMINQVADLLKAYYYEDRSQVMYDNMIRCLDTMNELVQGPCLENQIAVSESKFFEIASDLFSQKKDKDAKTGSMSASAVNMSKSKSNVNKSLFATSKSSASRKNTGGQDDLDDWMIARLQMKCLVLILSLIEMRELSDSNPIIKRIMRNLPMNLLQRHMVKCYKKYQLIYKDEYVMEVFNHVKDDPRDLDPKDVAKLPERYFESIIQNGFYIFFLMCYYYLCDPAMDNQFVTFYKVYRRRQLKQTKGALEDLLFGDNIIGQLVSFATSLLQQGFSIAKQLKLATYDRMMKNNQMTPEQLEKMQQEKQAQKKLVLRQSFDFFMKNSASIEVVRNDELEIVYFIKLPYTHLLPKEKKVEFSDWVDRGSTKSKVQGLVDQSNSLIEICMHEEELRRFFSRQKFLALFANYVKLWKDLAFIFTILLNLFIIGSFSDAYGDRLNNYHLFQQDNMSNDYTKQIFSICGIIMTCCSMFVVCFFLCKNAPLIIQKAWNEKTPFDGQDQNFIMWFVIIFVKLLTVLIFILKEIEVIYYLAYGALAVVGTVIHPFFFSFHLTEILIRYPTLKNVIRSVYNPREQLFLTLILFIILVYVYGLLGYTFFSDDYEGRCDSALYCFLFTFDWTFKANGGVGGYLSSFEDDADSPPVEKYKWGRFAFDNSSNIFLVIIMVNIVAGIIIDTFGSLREAEGEKMRDIEDKCFICGNLKTTFDRLSDNAAGGGFAHHIRINHYMWNYLFFIAYLRDKDPTEYTGIEQFVFQKIEKKDLNWFPFNKATELKGLEEDEEEEVGRVSRIQNDMSSVVDDMSKASKTLGNIKLSKQKSMNAL